MLSPSVVVRVSAEVWRIAESGLVSSVRGSSSANSPRNCEPSGYLIKPAPCFLSCKDQCKKDQRNSRSSKILRISVPQNPGRKSHSRASHRSSTFHHSNRHSNGEVYRARWACLVRKTPRTDRPNKLGISVTSAHVFKAVFPMAVHLISHPTSLIPGSIWQIEDPLPMSLVSTRHVAVILRPAASSEKITKGGRLAVGQ